VIFSVAHNVTIAALWYLRHRYSVLMIPVKMFVCVFIAIQILIY